MIYSGRCALYRRNAMPMPFLNVDGSGACAADGELIVGSSVFSHSAPMILPR